MNVVMVHVEPPASSAVGTAQVQPAAVTEAGVVLAPDVMNVIELNRAQSAAVVKTVSVHCVVVPPPQHFVVRDGGVDSRRCCGVIRAVVWRARDVAKKL